MMGKNLYFQFSYHCSRPSFRLMLALGPHHRGAHTLLLSPSIILLCKGERERRDVHGIYIEFKRCLVWKNVSVSVKVCECVRVAYTYRLAMYGNLIITWYVMVVFTQLKQIVAVTLSSSSLCNACILWLYVFLRDFHSYQNH